MAERRPVGFGRRDPGDGPDGAAPGGDERPWPAGAIRLDDAIASGLLPERSARGHKGTFGTLLVIAG